MNTDADSPGTSSPSSGMFAVRFCAGRGRVSTLLCCGEWFCMSCTVAVGQGCGSKQQHELSAMHTRSTAARGPKHHGARALTEPIRIAQPACVGLTLLQSLSHDSNLQILQSLRQMTLSTWRKYTISASPQTIISVLPYLLVIPWATWPNLHHSPHRSDT